MSCARRSHRVDKAETILSRERLRELRGIGKMRVFWVGGGGGASEGTGGGKVSGCASGEAGA